MVFIAGKTVWSMPERFKVVYHANCLQLSDCALYKCSAPILSTASAALVGPMSKTSACRSLMFLPGKIVQLNVVHAGYSTSLSDWQIFFVLRLILFTHTQKHTHLVLLLNIWVLQIDRQTNQWTKKLKSWSKLVNFCRLEHASDTSAFCLYQPYGGQFRD